jgi:hypothetical protein
MGAWHVIALTALADSALVTLGLEIYPREI